MLSLGAKEAGLRLYVLLHEVHAVWFSQSQLRILSGLKKNSVNSGDTRLAQRLQSLGLFRPGSVKYFLFEVKLRQWKSKKWRILDLYFIHLPYPPQSNAILMYHLDLLEKTFNEEGWQLQGCIFLQETVAKPFSSSLFWGKILKLSWYQYWSFSAQCDSETSKIAFRGVIGRIFVDTFSRHLAKGWEIDTPHDC